MFTRSFRTLTLARQTKISVSKRQFWSKVPLGPDDPILGVTIAFNKDTSPKKINLGVGAYRDDNGKPFVLECVREAERRIYEGKMNHEYAGIVGVPEFNKVARELALGKDSQVVKENRAVTIQTLSGTGALRVSGDFMNRFLDVPSKAVWLPKPTWGNHNVIFTDRKSVV